MHVRSSPPAFISREVRKARRFYLELNPAPHRVPRVACGGWERCAPVYRIRRNGFLYPTVEFVAGGQGWLNLGDQTYALGRGCIFSYGPNCPHFLETHPDDPLSKYFVSFTGRDAAALLKAHALAPGTCRTVAEPNDVQAAFEQVLVEGARSTNSSARITALLAQVLLLKMSTASEPQPHQHQSYQTFARCRTFLDEHFQEVSTAAEAATACHVDPAYASRLFARYGHGSFYGYLLRRKMAWAAELLDSGRLIVRETADKLGMDAFHFSRVFKRVHGISPACFLRRLENGSRKA